MPSLVSIMSPSLQTAGLAPGIVIKAGFEFSIEVAQSTTVLLLVGIAPGPDQALLKTDVIETVPPSPADFFIDAHGNRCARFRIEAGITTFRAIGIVRDSGLPETPRTGARQHPVHELPPDVLPFLFGSRYCETDLLTEPAWKLFGHTPEGCGRGSRRSAIGSTPMSNSGMPMPATPAPRSRPSPSGAACAGTSPTCRSHSAGP
jgi:hypothetical protein